MICGAVNEQQINLPDCNVCQYFQSYTSRDGSYKDCQIMWCHTTADQNLIVML